MKIILIVLAILFTYGTIATAFSDTAMVGGLGQKLGLANINLFGYFAYIDFIILFIFLFILFTSKKARFSLDFYLAWMLSVISILFIQALIAPSDYAGFIGLQVVDFLQPLIGKAGLWLSWIMIFALNVIFVFEDKISFKKIPIKIDADVLPKQTDSIKTQESKVKKTFKNPFASPQINDNDIEHKTKVQENESYKHTIADRMQKRSHHSHENISQDRSQSTHTSPSTHIESNVYEPTITKQKKNQDTIDLDSSTPLIDEIISSSVEDSFEDTLSIEEPYIIEEIETKPLKKSKKRVKPEVKKETTSNVKIVKELEENSKLLREIEKGKIEKPKNFKLPSLDFLQPAPKVKKKINEAEIDRKIEELLTKLQQFKVDGDVIRTYSGPLVTTFEFKPAPNVKVSKILGLQDDLAMALRAETIRIQAPIPGRDVVGIEIPNESIETIYLREILESKLFQESKSPLTVALGKDIVGNPFITDIKKLPHLLIAGTTGSGKSVGINAMILSLLYRNDPDHLKLMLIDPKMLEFSMYDDIPHLITPVIIEPSKAIAALANMVGEMERRYKLMA